MKNNDTMHAITKQTRITSEFDFLVEEIYREGFAVVENLISEEILTEMRSRIDKVYLTQVNEIGGEQNLAHIGDIGFAMSLLSYDSFFTVRS